jgi:hypothetical protein
MDTLKFVVLDDTTHAIGPGEYTACMVLIPQGSTWSTDEPKKLCPDCASRLKDTDEFGVLKPEKAVPEVPSPAPKATKEAKASGDKA